MSGNILVRRSGASHSEEVNMATDKYRAWFWRSTASNHETSVHKSLSSKSVFDLLFLSLKFCRCYFVPLCKIREHITDFQLLFLIYGQSQWPRGLRRGSETARLLRLWVRMPPGACMSVRLLWVLRVVRWMSLSRADHSCRGIIPTVVYVTEYDREASLKETLAQQELLRHGKRI